MNCFVCFFYLFCFVCKHHALKRPNLRDHNLTAITRLFFTRCVVLKRSECLILLIISWFNIHFQRLCYIHWNGQCKRWNINIIRPVNSSKSTFLSMVVVFVCVSKQTLSALLSADAVLLMFDVKIIAMLCGEILMLCYCYHCDRRKASHHLILWFKPHYCNKLLCTCFCFLFHRFTHALIFYALLFYDLLLY